MVGPDFWEKVYDILVEKAGAPTVGSTRGCFLASQPSPEFRFCGNLGFGGKFGVDGERLRVSCYSEDRNEERDEIIRVTNIALEQLVRDEKRKAELAAHNCGECKECWEGVCNLSVELEPAEKVCECFDTRRCNNCEHLEQGEKHWGLCYGNPEERARIEKDWRLHNLNPEHQFREFCDSWKPLA